MKILGIDPGTARMGFGVVEKLGSSLRALGFGCIKTDKDERREKRLQIIHEELHKVIKEYRPDMMAQELLFFSKNAKTALLVGEARGVILLAASQNLLEVHEYTPLQVKESLSGYGRASKSEVQELVQLHLNIEKFKGNDDAADALAIALCHIFYMETGDFR
jgi:crossover junction endodeoxyribonuclease RuvC